MQTPMTPENAAGTGDSTAPPALEQERVPPLRPPCERDRRETEKRAEWDREARVQELVPLAEAREVDRDGERGDGGEPAHERAPRCPCPGSAHATA